jgi:hypothetical protein
MAKQIARPAQIPQDEMWLFMNQSAWDDVQHGLEEAEQGEVTYIGSFATFADDETD